MTLTNEAYDALQKVVRLIIPLVIFLTAVGDIWGLSWMAPVTATISAFGIFLGAALEISSKNYHANKDAEVLEDDLEDEEE